MTHILRHIALALALIFVGISANAAVQDYDVKQLPYFADLADGHITEYLYDASGRKLQTKYLVDNRSVFAASVAGEIENDELIATADSSMIETELIRDYVGNYVYEDSVLERIITPNGYITSVGTYKYYILDHQGNITTTVPINMRSPWIDYYPFGSSMARMEGSERYKFSGKEFDTKNGIYLYDFHARQYSPIHGRFTSLDPLCEIDYAISPYAFCAGNPVNFIDPTGMRPTDKEAAQIAAHVYGGSDVMLSGGWNLIGDIVKQENGLQYGIYGRELDDGSADYVLAFAGTDLLDFNDLSNNISQSLGWNKISQYENALPIANNFMNYFWFGDQTIVGHSLGGGLAASASMYTGLPAITFNPAVLTNSTKIKLGIYSNKTNQIHNYIVIGDIVTNIQNRIGLKADGKTTLIPPYKSNKLNPFFEHSISTVIKSL